jgi:hypothetical protein
VTPPCHVDTWAGWFAQSPMPRCGWWCHAPCLEPESAVSLTRCTRDGASRSFRFVVRRTRGPARLLLLPPHGRPPPFGSTPHSTSHARIRDGARRVPALQHKPPPQRLRSRSRKPRPPQRPEEICRLTSRPRHGRQRRRPLHRRRRRRFRRAPVAPRLLRCSRLMSGSGWVCLGEVSFGG